MEKKKPGRPKKVAASGGGEIPIPFSVDVTSFKTALAQPIQTEISRVEGYLDELRSLLSTLGIGTATNGKATPAAAKVKAPRKTADNAEELTGEALTAKGNNAVAYLRKKPGEWIDGPEIAEKIGYKGVSKAIDAADDGQQVEKKGPGRKRQYKIKA